MKLNDITPDCIDWALKDRLEFTRNNSELCSRYSAYDFCYNYFNDFPLHKKTEIASSENMTISCLHLGMFLATWGMYRNSFLQRNSFKIYEPLIKKIAEEKRLWGIDVVNYKQDGNIKYILDFRKKLITKIESLEIEGSSATDTLITKIMMGVFGCVPAYDELFTATLHNKSLGDDSLKEIYGFYCKHKDKLDDKQKQFKTVNVNGNFTDHTYSKAKLIDLIAFRIRQKEILKGRIKDKSNNKKVENLKSDLLDSVIDELTKYKIPMKAVDEILDVPEEHNQRKFFEYILSEKIGWDLQKIRKAKEIFEKSKPDLLQ